MHIGVVTLFPPMFEAVTGYGITGRAVRSGLLRLDLWNPRDYARDRHRTVDDRPYGGGPGMVMLYEPLVAAIRAARDSVGPAARVLCLTPQGRRLSQAAVTELAARPGFVLVAGRYEGIDERVIEAAVDEEWSVGDYVVSGGELPAMVVIDAVTRLLPDALGHRDSAREDSFCGGILDYPHYTRPEVVEGHAVPPVLLSGNHAEVRRWRLKQALGRTRLRRPDLLAAVDLDRGQEGLLQEFMREQAEQAGSGGP
jgi:tRNA (guanine37-N1)-methyltransferase